MTTIEPADWQKSDFCGTGACVEVSLPMAGPVFIRDSKDPEGPVLEFTQAEWDAFVQGIKADRFARR
jgi:hypothetical protein